MKFNNKKAQKSTIEHYDKMLDNNRKERSHESADGSYQKYLDKNRTNEEEKDLWEKTLSKHHSENKDQPRTTEARLNDADKRDDSTHKTNTLPINELAEEAQRARIEARGDGDGFEKDHFQDYKKESFNLSKQNYARLSGIISQIDKLWMASSWKRMTTAEKNDVKALIAKRDQIIKESSNENRHN